MTAKDIFNGSTGNRATILIINNADGLPKTGVAWNAAGLSISYRIGTGSGVAITLSSSNWFEVGGGKYYVDVADSVYAAGNLGSLVQFYGALTDSSVYGEQHRVVAYNPLAVAVGANTTTPPTVGAIADAVYDEPYAGHTTPGTYGFLWDRWRKANPAINGEVVAGTLTTTSFSSDITSYSAAAFRGATLLFINGSTHAEFASPIISYNPVNGVFTLEQELPSAPVAGDEFIVQPANFVHTIASVTSGVWSALTSGLNVVGSTGRAVARLIGLVEDSSGDRFTAKALEEGPSSAGGVVQVLPALGVAAGRGDQTTLVAYVGETISTSITVYQADGTTAYDLSGKTLAVIFENPKTGDDVAVVPNGSITISGTDDNIVTFAYPSAATSAQRELVWTLRDASAPKTVYLRGVLEVRAAATAD